MITRMLWDVVKVLQYSFDCNNTRCSDVVLEGCNVVLKCSKWWMMSYDHDDIDNVRCVARV